MVDGIEWRRFDPPALPIVGGFYSASIWPSEDRFLAEAYRCSAAVARGGDCLRDQLLLESNDGEAWTILGRITSEPALVEGIIEHDLGFFAGGTLEGGGGSRAGLWRSADGREWDSIADLLDPRACGDGTPRYVSAFYPTPRGLIASGSGKWLTTNGTEWSCVPTIPNIRVAPGHGSFVGSGDGHMWFSPDGLTWEQVAAAAGNVVAVEDGFVALVLRYPGGQLERLMTSSDGQNWTAEQSPFGTVSLARLSSDGKRAVLIEEGDFDQGAGAIWVSSADGVDWARFGLPRRQGDNASGVAILGNRIVVTGALYQDNTYGATVVWVADIP